jgi:RimJ/RimL family protein N-acetyltransferase
MKETQEDIDRLQAVLDASIERAGDFLRRSFQMPAHSLSAAEVIQKLQGLQNVALATVTAKGEPRVAPIGALFYRGDFYIPTVATAARTRHIKKRPAVSLTRFAEEDLAIIVHGSATIITADHPDFETLEELLQTYSNISVNTWGEGVYLHIHAETIYTYIRYPGTEGSILEIRPITDEDRSWVQQFTIKHWGGSIMITPGGTYYPHTLPGFIAIAGEERVGLLTYSVSHDSCEIVTLNSERQGTGIGTRLVAAAKQAAHDAHCRRLWLVTTNDNLNALRFYQKRGFRLVAVHRNTVDAARQQKPQIPYYGNDQIPLHDEIELEMMLEYEAGV